MLRRLLRRSVSPPPFWLPPQPRLACSSGSASVFRSDFRSIIRPTLIRRQLTTRQRRPTTQPRPLIRRPGLQISRQAVMLPPDLRRARRSPTRRGAAGQTRKVNIAGNTGPPGLRAIVRPSVTAPPAGMRAANGGLLIEIGRGGGRSGPASRSGINVLCRQVRGARPTTADRHGLRPAARAARPIGRMSRREPD